MRACAMQFSARLITASSLCGFVLKYMLWRERLLAEGQRLSTFSLIHRLVHYDVVSVLHGVMFFFPQCDVVVSQRAAPVLMRVGGQKVDEHVVFVRSWTLVVNDHEPAASRCRDRGVSNSHEIPEIVERCLRILLHD